MQCKVCGYAKERKETTAKQKEGTKNINRTLLVYSSTCPKGKGRQQPRKQVNPRLRETGSSRSRSLDGLPNERRKTLAPPELRYLRPPFNRQPVLRKAGGTAPEAPRRERGISCFNIEKRTKHQKSLGRGEERTLLKVKKNVLGVYSIKGVVFFGVWFFNWPGKIPKKEHVSV